ncbi:uncharacterized protein LOC129719691 [Wyeomyia smithii]|uniref:uncharacterized protein LOC129719691 n=1 Tax=Wyeomyia smithii TaxID=174621 RepID=UPI002467B888|nr:uncharacterized protein LOC129719691 [Wyeomyia smithii]
MGSPLSPILADIVLDSVIESATNSLPFRVPFIKKYVDDLILAIPENSSQIVLNVFNSQEKRIQFTLETEQNQHLPFLDLRIVRKDDQTLTTEWYAKPIASGRMLNYNSFHQLKYKINTACNFINRVTTFSTTSTYKEQKAIIYKLLQQNSYPKTLISRLLQHRAQKNNTKREDPIVTQPPTNQLAHITPQQPISIQHSISPQHTTPNQPSNEASTTGETANQPTHLLNIPHNSILLRANHPTKHQPPKVKRASRYRTKLKKILTPDYAHITISSRQHNTVSQLHTVVKDLKTKEEHSHIIYKIPCSDCNSCYIGMTQNRLNMRLAGHKSNVNKLQQILSASTNTKRELDELKEKTALINHCIQHKHSFDFSRTTIIDHSNRTHILPFLEMCHIHNTPNTVNKRVDLDGLNTAYAAVLSSLIPNTNAPAN